MKPDHDASINFLKLWSPGGPWVLTAVQVERKGIETRTFNSEDADLARNWIEGHGANKWNVYFHVNPTTRALSSKASREDIKEMAWLHVDIDPRVGEDIKEERERALKLLQETPGDLPPPTCIVFSGGGYQGFWKLETPFPINGQEQLYEDAKRYNVQLELIFGADNCHNVDRIMRVPGTVNWPDQKKREKGRVPTVAELVEWHEDRVYELTQFTPAPLVQTPGDGAFSGGGVKVEVSGNIERLSGVDDPRLKGVMDLAKVVIVQGNDPEDPTRFAKDGGTGLDRSKALFFVCCRMADAGCDDDTIYAVITDPDFKISESVLDKGSMAEKYALRQIGQAREHIISPDLHEMNKQHAVISNWSGKCRVIEEVYDHTLGRYKLTKQSFEDFRNRYMHQTVDTTDSEGKIKSIAKGKWWLTNRHRRQYDTIIFAPGHEFNGSYNLWRGFACDAKPGDCSKCLEHIRDNLCAGVEAHYHYLLGWMASAVQHPDRPGYSAVVLRGRTGTGKSFFVSKIFGSLFGRHFLQVSDPKHIVGSFNAHLRDCIVLFAEEAFYAGDKKHESILKMLVTEDMLIIEPKGVDAEMGANCVHLLMASNESWVVPAGLDDRRFFVLDAGTKHKEDKPYFKALEKELDNGGREALLHYLLNYDLSEFDVRTVPKTKALLEQKLHSMDSYQEWWFQKLRMGVILEEHSLWQVDVSSKHVQLDFLEYAKSFNLTRRGNATKLGQMLKTFVPEGWPKLEQRSTPVAYTDGSGVERTIRRPYYYTFPSLQECRDYWDSAFGGPYDWEKSLDESPIPETPF